MLLLSKLFSLRPKCFSEIRNVLARETRKTGTQRRQDKECALFDLAITHRDPVSPNRKQNSRCDSLKGAVSPENLRKWSPVLPDISGRTGNGFLGRAQEISVKNVTKAEQYSSMRTYRRSVIRPSKGGDSKECDGNIPAIEKTLNKRLALLQRRGISEKVPSFYRLQVFSDCWDDLCNVAGDHADSLREIKRSYDRYVHALLDAQVGSNQPLCDNVKLLGEMNGCSAESLKIEEAKLKLLEEEVRIELERNERLRKELADEEDLAKKRIALEETADDERLNQTAENSVSIPPLGIEDEVLALHAKIKEQLLKMDNLRRDKREKYVPIAVYHRLGQSLKETEVDIQKLCKQNVYLESTIQGLEEEIEEILNRTGVKEKEARLLWKKVNTSRVFETSK